MAFNNKVLLQWGMSSESAFYTFPIAFTKKPSIVGLPYCHLSWDASSQFNTKWLITNMSSTSFQVHTSVNYSINWIAIGN